MEKKKVRGSNEGSQVIQSMAWKSSLFLLPLSSFLFSAPFYLSPLPSFPHISFFPLSFLPSLHSSLSSSTDTLSSLSSGPWKALLVLGA